MEAPLLQSASWWFRASSMLRVNWIKGKANDINSNL
jgi:hypothetical protein